MKNFRPVKILVAVFVVIAVGLAVTYKLSDDFRGIISGTGTDEDCDSFTLYLHNPGDQPVAVINLIRMMMGLPLPQANAIVSNAPTAILTGLLPELAESYERSLEEAGADVEILSECTEAGGGPAVGGDATATPCNQYKVVLTDFGPSRIGVIRLLQSLISLPLRDIYKLVQNPPAEIASGVSRDTALLYEKRLKEIGAGVTLTPLCPEPAPVSQPPAEQQQERDCHEIYSVYLVDVGSDENSIAKILRQLIGCGLNECVALMKAAPTLIATNLSQQEASNAEQSLTGAGAAVRVKQGCDYEVPGEANEATATEPVCNSYKVFMQSYGRSRLAVIKLLRELTGRLIRDIKLLVESVPVDVINNVSRESADSMARALAEAGATVQVLPDQCEPSPAAPAGGTAEAGCSYSVRLESFGLNKVGVVKLLNVTLGIGLKRAKDLAEAAPVDIKSNISEMEADFLVKTFTEIGAIVTSQEHCNPARPLPL